MAGNTLDANDDSGRILTGLTGYACEDACGALGNQTTGPTPTLQAHPAGDWCDHWALTTHRTR